MKLSVRSLLETRLSLKVVSFIFALSLWLVLGSRHMSSLQLNVPITFYGNGLHKTVEGPENITIKLTGKRDDLYNLNTQTIALHYNIDEMEEGEHLLDVTPEKLFLPNTIKLVHWSPTNPVISIGKKS